MKTPIRTLRNSIPSTVQIPHLEGGTERLYGLDQNTTVHHWQLKDLVACESSRVLYCIHERNSIRYDTQKQRASVVQTMSFSPNCMTIGHGYIAAGGPGSRLDIRLLNEEQSIFNGSVGGAVNNSLHINEYPLGLLLFVCNNDRTIKAISLPDMDIMTTLQFPQPVNYAASTQNAEYLLSVGDNVYAYIHQTADEGYRRLAQLEGYTGVGMCCAWDPQGVRLAAASQDGTVRVWDRRSLKVINTFTAPSSCRNVKFSSFPMDLMAFTEDTGACHLVDTRNMKTRQVLKIDDGRVDLNISGLCFAPDGRKLFVGTTGGGIFAFNIDTAGRRRLSDGSFL